MYFQRRMTTEYSDIKYVHVHLIISKQAKCHIVEIVIMSCLTWLTFWESEINVTTLKPLSDVTSRFII